MYMYMYMYMYMCVCVNRFSTWCKIWSFKHASL